MAACVSMALVKEWRRRAGAWRALVWASNLRKVAASSQFRVGAFLVPPRVPLSCASVLPSPHSWLPGSCERGNEGCVNR